ncbi:gamma-glutamyl-gamma-aminobutyrate hydrolase family protein [Gallaecimonas sp. GXIMD4217]|uniref:gamma-glutamyl-gamma-aminobutyrate hydrolase family protein n=1 Tax=Gallaecimonas sp. GXIMD4217 TaxID=3131927 RepID=UPI00311B0404
MTGNHRRFSPAWLCIRLSVFLAGGRAVRISIRHQVDLKQVEALVISGGDDIHPALYDEAIPPHDRYDEGRDELELHHIEYALAKGLPLLGICRGAQLLNVALGGSLYANIRRLRHHTSNRPTPLPRKTALLVPESRLHRILGVRRVRINSLHYQAMDQVARALAVSARDYDNFVQGVEHKGGLPWLGVQWHPEYLFYQKEQRRLFRWLVAQALHRRRRC